MYTKLFEKILDSSIWIEPQPTRIVWITLLAVMDEDGFCHFAKTENLALRANIALEETRKAILTLESPDPDSSDPDNEGRRVERVPGGWMVLNAKKYKDIATREREKEQVRERVSKHREKKRDVTLCNGGVTQGVLHVTLSESESESESNTLKDSCSIEDVYSAYPRKIGRKAALKAIDSALKRLAVGEGEKKLPLDQGSAFLLHVTQTFAHSPAGQKGEYTPHPATWFNASRYLDDPQEWQRTNGTNGNGHHPAHEAESPVAAQKRMMEESERDWKAKHAGAAQ